MQFDVIFVTYNSSKWLDGCINSILKSDYDLKNLSLYFYDNKSSDDTVKRLKEIKEKNGKLFGDFVVIEGAKNKGFGYGNNQCAKLGKSPYIFVLNIDTEVFPDTFKKIENHINLSNDVYSMWELKQIPFEHPKYYNPINGEVSWASGACSIFKRDMYEKVNGFDEEIFMYCEDVEISWNIRKNGGKIKYLFDTPIIHYSYSKPNEFKYNQFVYGLVGNLYLRAKYGSFKNYLKGCSLLVDIIRQDNFISQDLDSKIKRKIKNNIFKILFTKGFKYLFVNLFTSKGDFAPSFINDFDYEITRSNGFYKFPEISSNPLVSIIVRTCGRPDVLRETLISLRNQTYKNIEIVIVEDGKNISEKMITKEFKDLNINYYATGKKVGRSAAGNIAMSRAKGKYFNFLDDDDYFYPDHVECLVKYLEFNQVDVAFSLSFNIEVNVENKSPYKYSVINKGKFGWLDLPKTRLYSVNLYPIQAVMFKGDLFSECGGLDESIDALEDWDFWVRLSLKHSFYGIDYVTSIFKTPYDKEISKERQKFLNDSLDYLNHKFKSYDVTLTAFDIRFFDK